VTKHAVFVGGDLGLQLDYGSFDGGEVVAVFVPE